MVRWKSPRLHRWAARDLVACLLVGALLLEGGLFLWVSNHPPLAVSAGWSPDGAGLSARLTLQGGLSGGPVRVSLLPGELSTDPGRYIVLSFVDRSYPSYDGPASDILATSDWIGNYLTALHQAADAGVGVVDAGSLPGNLALHPRSTLLVLVGGILPDWVFSANSSLLRDWVSGGGTLIWASGPIGYYSAQPGPSGRLVHSDLGWAGQLRFLGFNLTDPPRPGSSPPSGAVPVGENASPLGEALGLSYDAVPFGANVSELVRHGGTPLGFETAAGPAGSPSARTSIAYLPFGQGRILYFGGGTLAPGYGTISGGSGQLTQDIATLIELGYRPGTGAPATDVVRVGPLGSTLAQLTISNRSSGVVAMARTSVPGSVLFVWDQQLVPTTATPSDHPLPTATMASLRALSSRGWPRRPGPEGLFGAG